MSNYPSPHADLDGDRSGRHPVNVGHLVMGVAFLGLAAVWVLVETEAVGGDDLRWFLPLPWLAAGLAGLLAVALTSRRPRPDHTGGPVEPEPAWGAHDDLDPLDELDDLDGPAAGDQRA